jgi:hypothetical protein
LITDPKQANVSKVWCLGQNKRIIYFHPRFIPEGVAETSQILFRDAHVLSKLFGYEEYCRRGQVVSPTQSISGVSTVNPLVAFTTSMEEKERCYSKWKKLFYENKKNTKLFITYYKDLSFFNSFLLNSFLGQGLLVASRVS